MVRTEVPAEPAIANNTGLIVKDLDRPKTAGVVVADRETVPLRPKLFTVIVEELAPPATKAPGEIVVVVNRKSPVMIRIKLT